MPPRRLGLIVLVLALVVGAAFWWLGGDIRSGARGAPTPATESAPAEEAGRLDAALAGPGTGTLDARRALVALMDQQASDDSELRDMPLGRATLIGRVVDERGAPIAGAAVRTASSVAARALHRATGNDFFDAEIEVASTDSLGVFRIERSAGSACASIRAPGFAPATVPGILLAPGEETRVDDIVLESSALVTGVVLDDAGAVVADVRMLDSSAAGGDSQRTGADGTFRFEELERSRVVLFADHANYAPQRIEVDARQADAVPFITVRLSPGDVIEGRLEGFPPSEFSGYAVAAKQLSSKVGLRGEDRIAAVNSAGHFRLRGLASDESWQVFAQPASAVGANADARVSDVLSVLSGERDVVLHRRPRSTIRFRVVDRATRAPVEWLTIRWGIHHHERQAELEELEYYEGGSVRLETMPFGPHPRRLEVDGAQYESFIEPELRLDPGQNLDLGTIELVPAPRMRVTVLDARNDRPVVGAEVGWTEHDPWAVAASEPPTGQRSSRATWRRRSRGYDAHPTARTDEHGRATLEGRPGHVVELSVTAPGFASAHVTEWQLPEAGDADKVVRLEQGGGVVFLATDAEGGALVGRTIEHRLFGLPWVAGRSDGRRARPNPERLLRVTDSSGRARFDDLPPGAHEFRIAEPDDSGALHLPSTKPPLRRLLRERKAWTVVDVEAYQESAVTLTEAPRGAIFGRITEQGRPLARTRVGLFSYSYRIGMAFQAFATDPRIVATDDGGRYRIDDVEPGSYVLRIQRDADSTTFNREVEVPLGETRSDVELGTGVLAGRVVDVNGQGVHGVSVFVEANTQEDARRRHLSYRLGAARHTEQVSAFGLPDIRTDDQGRWEIHGVRSGIEVIAMAGGRLSDWQPACSETLTLLAGQRVDDVVLVVRLGGTLAVRVSEDEQDASPPFEILRLERVVGTETVEVLALLNGMAATVPGLAPGSWTLGPAISEAISEAGATSVLQPFEIVAGETTRVEYERTD